MGSLKLYEYAVALYKKTDEVACLEILTLFLEGHTDMNEYYYKGYEMIDALVELNTESYPHQKCLDTIQMFSEQGNSVAQYIIGAFAKKRHSITKMELSASLGNSMAQYVMGQHYEKIGNDYDKIIEYYTKSSDQGNYMAKANLGLLYQSGKEIDIDYAVELLSDSAKQGSSLAQNRLGYMYMIGQGVNINYAKAMELFCKSSDEKYAQENLHILFKLPHLKEDKYFEDMKKIFKSNYIHPKTVKDLLKIEFEFEKINLVKECYPLPDNVLGVVSSFM
jgi:TPR repeat protein